MNRDDYRHLLLSGTVTFPATFPQIGSISLTCEPIPRGIECHLHREMLTIKEFPSAKVTISRKVFVDKVRAVFIPQDPNRVSYACGTWLLGDEIAAYLRCQERVLGIVFVAETESTLLEVHAGMTAGESAQYYPPLPSDRSFNHYGGQAQKRHMMSCSTMDSSPMAMEELCKEVFYSCDGHDDISFEMCACDACDTPSDS
jgi:hypothetical protein